MDGIPASTPRMVARSDGPVGWMMFDNPARRNAVSTEMWAAIPGIIQRYEDDPSIRVIALSGTGHRAFVAGADISQFESQRNSPETVKAYEQVGQAASHAIRYASKPTVAVVRGWCIGGGVGIAAGCDIRWAAEGARFGIPAGRLGLGYGYDGVKNLVDLVGPAFARELFYTARHFSAAEALAMGLVNRVLPDDALDAFVAEQFALMAANAPLTLHAVKRAVAEVARGPEADKVAVAELVRSCFESADYAEGRRAFMEKRAPVFTGS